ncbi:hypothetical protein [Rhodalgimonas zhirmunskyi]|uniref:Uncharacterized protein n=1 Tax=Rhodalgimonas zhirmunskyi TaxID=2964767 RepID=A0AAJ1U8Y1_9RHOB|nr:hypothetical protein [Rhodoalgimonas zhirmunskyi]MDQ2095144.1 hypothetical protein [Rhodoalgimonas zhirmunskyi]
MSDELWTFERLAPGAKFGPVEVPLNGERVEGWQGVYGPVAGDHAPDGLIVAGMMEAYIRAIQPRPKGNVHAAQKLSFTGQRARLGETVTYTVEVLSKEQKKGRNWIVFAIAASAGGTPLLRGEVTAIWAA